MDDLFIQEEVIVKTEPLDGRHHFEDNLSEKFLLDGPNNDDLLAYLNHPNSKEKNYIKKEAFAAVDPQNIFETGSHFMDPDTMIAHYEEVVQDIGVPHMNSDDFMMNVKSPVKKEIKQKKCTKKKKGGKNEQVNSHNSLTKSKLLTKSIKVEEEEDERLSGFSFECSLCMFTTESETNLKRHMLDHIGGPDTDTFVEESHNGEAYTCLFCPFISVSADLFRDHIKYKHSGFAKASRKRNKKTSSYPLRGLPPPPTESNDEDDDDDEDNGVVRSLATKKETSEHMPCKLCTVTTRSRQELHKHMIQSHPEKLLECSHCDFFTVYKSTLKRHEMRHTQVKAYKCKNCHFSTYNIATFNNHEASHAEVKPFPCDECNFRAKSKDSLRQHKKLHSGDMPFICSFCSYKAGKKSRIIRHERIHTGERPYACPHCNFKCNQGSTLKIHIRRHTGEKPYECTLCSFRAVSKCSLNAHLKKHYANKGIEFVCQVCEQIYNNFAALRKHEKTHDEPSEGYLKQVQNKKRKSDLLAETAEAVEPPKPLRRKRQKKQQQQSSSSTSSSSKRKRNSSEEVDEEDIQGSSPISRLYRCTVCPFRCSKFVDLSDHMSTHKKASDDLSSVSIPKKYRCTPCNLSFSRKREMKSHMKNKHETKKDRDKEDRDREDREDVDRGVTIKIGDYVLSVSDG